MLIKIGILLIMIFLHIKEDYNQGIIADLKQKSWWEKNEPDKMYKNDYKIVLFLHAFSWTFIVMLPVVIYAIVNNAFNEIKIYDFYLIAVFVGNLIIHYIIDDMKANKKTINLMADQLIHIAQIIYMWILVFIIK